MILCVEICYQNWSGSKGKNKVEQETLIEVKKIRDSNLELFRIIVMFFIIAHHYVVNSGLMDRYGVLAQNQFSLNRIGINSFL